MQKSRLKKRSPRISQGLWHLGFLVGNQRDEVIHLLRYYRIPVSKEASKEVLIRQLLTGVAVGGQDFHWDLAELIEEEYANFTGGKGGKGMSSIPDLPGVTVGADPVSAVAGAIGSVANVVGFAQQKKNNKQMASREMTQSLLASRTPVPAATSAPQTTNTPTIDNKVLLAGFVALALIAIITKLQPRIPRVAYHPVTPNSIVP